MTRQRHQQLWLIVICLLLLAACRVDGIEKQQETDLVTSDPVRIGYSMWLVDWLYDESLTEASEIVDGMDHLFLFGIYFNDRGELYEIEQMSELLQHALEDERLRQKDLYITIVNDQFITDGTVIQKNPELLDELLNTSAVREAHIADIVQFAKTYPIAGIEIDYEKIPTTLASDYVLFIEALKHALEKEGLSLRVVLEPSFPIDDYPLPEDVSYVVMAYNLYGYHSGPGPKADFAFLDQISSRFSNEHGHVGIALATGGFAWQDEQVTAFTNEQIADIIIRHAIEPTRDPDSGALTFMYEEDGIEIEVWFADAETITLWSEYLIEHGYRDFSIWRAGGLTEDLLQLFTSSTQTSGNKGDSTDEQ